MQIYDKTFEQTKLFDKIFSVCDYILFYALFFLRIHSLFFSVDRKLDAFLLAEVVDELVGDVDLNGAGMETDISVAGTVDVEVQLGFARMLVRHFCEVFDKINGETVERDVDGNALNERILHIDKKFDVQHREVVGVGVIMARTRKQPGFFDSSP